MTTYFMYLAAGLGTLLAVVIGLLLVMCIVALWQEIFDLQEKDEEIDDPEHDNYYD